MRISTPFRWYDCATYCKPTRMAPRRLSRPSGSGLCSRCQRVMTTAAPTDSTAFSRNTQALPRLAMMLPAISGPRMREAFIDTPLSASAAGSLARGTRSGTMAENTGQRSARPTPFMNSSINNSGGVTTFMNTANASSAPTTATQTCVKNKKCFRFRMSASAPEGSPSRNTGSVAAVCTSATQIGLDVSVVISHAAATSFIHMHRLATSQVLHSMVNTLWRNGASGPRSSSAAAALAWSESGMGHR